MTNFEKKRLEQIYANSLFANKITFDEYVKCQCAYCEKKCIHKDAFRRYPLTAGGLGLCENLK